MRKNDQYGSVHHQGLNGYQQSRLIVIVSRKLHVLHPLLLLCRGFNINFPVCGSRSRAKSVSTDRVRDVIICGATTSFCMPKIKRIINVTVATVKIGCIHRDSVSGTTVVRGSFSQYQALIAVHTDNADNMTAMIRNYM